MAKDVTYVVAGPDAALGANVIRGMYPTQEKALEGAEECAKSNPGRVFTVYQAVADLQTGEIPITRTDYRHRTDYRQSAKCNKGEAE